MKKRLSKVEKRLAALEQHPTLRSQLRAGPHVNPLEVNTSFVQTFNSCVCASYAMAASYFTGLPVSVWMAGYLEHFGESAASESEAEKRVADHFDAEWRKRQCRGYEVLLDLHRHSSVDCFRRARRVMKGTFFVESNVAELEGKLRARASFLNAAFERSPGNYHSVTVFSDGNYLFERDTNRREFRLLRSLDVVGSLRDSVLYTGRRRAMKRSDL